VSRRYEYNALARILFDLLAAAPEGLDIHEIADELGVPKRVVYGVIGRLRILQGHDDTINVVWRSQGSRRVYCLTGNLDDCKEWTHFRLRMIESWLRMTMAVLSALIRATDGRTIDGRIARKLHMHFQRALEDLAEVRGELPGMT
jgi:hypothetical protein